MALLGVVLTLLVPTRRALDLHSTLIEPSGAGEAGRGAGRTRQPDRVMLRRRQSRTVSTARPTPSPTLGGRTAWVVLTVGQFAAVVAVLQRSSLGVATTDALARFGITAATLGAFSMVQLLVYAAMQVPVGVLIDRYGSRLLIVLGLLIMAGAQTMFAFASRLPTAFAARVVLGVGDALVFISVMRLVPAWFPPERSAKLTNATGPVNQLGFVLSAVGFAGVLAAAGWTPSFLSAAAVSAARGCWRCCCSATRRSGGRRAYPSRTRSPRPATRCARRGRNRAPGWGSGWGSWPCSRA